MAERLLIFGGTGDLAGRYLLPALARLLQLGLLPGGMRIIGLSRQPWGSERYREWAQRRLADYASGVDSASLEELITRLEYQQADVSDPDQVTRLARGDGPIIAYLALPPALFPTVVTGLGSAGLQPRSRVVVEKPFGEDLESARRLNELLHSHFSETSVFRFDHFLGHQTVQNILGLRFANRVFEPLWNREHIERVEIIWEETLGLEGRAGYYDHTGALRDMLQNHLLQLLSLVAMEPPATLSERDLRDRKAELLRAVRTPTPEEVERDTIRARYSAGSVEGRPVPAYVDEEGVDPDRRTETFVQVILYVQNWRWAGVPFLLRSGKAMAKKRQEIIMHYRSVPHLAFGETKQPSSNVLVLGLRPDRITLDVNINGPGDVFSLERTRLSTMLAPQEVPPYGRLLLDVLEGEQTFTIRDDEAEESWRIVEPILAAWRAERVRLQEYPAGSAGPGPL